MTLNTQFFTSRFGRRVMTLFVVAAMIPVGLSALVSYYQVTKALAAQSVEDLREDARSYGLLLIEKLTLSDTMLGELADDPEGFSGQAAAGQEMSQWFRSVTRVAGGEAMQALLGSPASQAMVDAGLDKLGEHDKPVVVTYMDRHSRSHVLLLRALPGAGAQQAFLLAEVDPGYLWGDPGAYPEQVDFCVVTESGALLNCSRQVPLFVLADLANRSGSAAGQELDWQSNSKAFMGTDWHLFVKSRFEADNWSILAFKPREEALAAMSGFNNLYFKVALLALLLVAFLSSIQIRRSLVPLEKLVAGTRRIAVRDFSDPIDVRSGDEFEQLAVSMNEMGERLRRQFHALGILSRLDRMILSSNGLEPVVDTFFSDIHKIVPCEHIMLAIIDRDADDFVKFYEQGADPESETTVTRVTISKQHKHFLAETESDRLLDGPSPEFDLINRLFEHEVDVVRVIPIMRGQVAAGFIALGYKKESVPDQAEMQPARDFADRIAVAISSTEHEEHLYRQAHFDPLTGLPNRQLFFDRLSQELSYARRDNRLGALMFIDLDNFKRLNDSLGHSIGDELLRAAAGRLQRCVRDADTVARLGGDEFTVIIAGIPSVSTASTIADTILDEFSKPFLLGKIEHFISASIGITLFPDDGIDAEKLLKNADTAMYRAKGEGRARKAFFEDSMHAAAMRRIEIEAELRCALDSRSQFYLQYQPQICLDSGRVSGMEALVRWHHPERGVIPPDEFISIAEECGVIHDLGLWVLRQAAEQYRSWRDQGLEPGRICVNVSTQQFKQATFSSCVRTVLLETGLAASELELEITESLLADDRKSIMSNLNELQVMGVRLAIDDFGTGYSSLSYLRRFKFDTLKIDRAFVNGLPDVSQITGITDAIVQMAHALDKNVVAEGIENLHQLAYLKLIGCDQAQGFYFAKPLDPSAAAEFMMELVSQPLLIEKAG